jgi:hypothetical protein
MSTKMDVFYVNLGMIVIRQSSTVLANVVVKLYELNDTATKYDAGKKPCVLLAERCSIFLIARRILSYRVSHASSNTGE